MAQADAFEVAVLGLVVLEKEAPLAKLPTRKIKMELVSCGSATVEYY